MKVSPHFAWQPPIRFDPTIAIATSYQMDSPSRRESLDV